MLLGILKLLVIAKKRHDLLIQSNGKKRRKLPRIMNIFGCNSCTFYCCKNMIGQLRRITCS